MHNRAMAMDQWIWDGGRVGLDFVNTLRNRWRTQPEETLGGPADLTRWLRESGLVAPDTPDPADVDAGALSAARRLREAVDRAVLAAAEGALPASADVELLNASALAAPRPASQLAIVDGRLVPAGTPALAAEPTAGLGLIAQDVIDLLLSADIRRVRVCKSDRCGLRFLDRSPAHNRRWCSMSRCGNRTKVRLHQARSHA